MSRKKIVQIPSVVPDGAKKLGALELNSYHFDRKHTVLTPSLLEGKS